MEECIMLDLEAYGIIGYIIFIIGIIIVRLIASIILACAIVNYIGLTGIVWWAAAIVIFFIINALMSGFRGGNNV